MMVAFTSLDEYQGMTDDLMKTWLASAGWIRQETDTKVRLGHWTHPDYPKKHIWEHSLIGYWSLDMLMRVYKVSIQELLRMINPRWIKGFPSQEALAEHDTWLVKTEWGAECVADISYGGSDDGYMVMIPPCSQSSECEFIPEKYWPNCMFWPCDGNASRVRWPTNAKGEML